MATFTTLASFPLTDRAPIGGLVADAPGNLYGTTLLGGAWGTVFEIAKTDAGYSTTPTVLVNFNLSNGEAPDAGLIIDAAGNLYGTTELGGANGKGTVFEVARTATGYSSTPITLASFNGTNGSAPEAPLIMDAAGNLYGTTNQGGANDLGTVFEIAKTSTGYSAVTTLVTFDRSNGAGPAAGLTLDSAGNLFGTTKGGGSGSSSTYGYGTVFEIARTNTGYSTTPTTLVSFNLANGAYPEAPLAIDAAGNLFGTTFSGGGTTGYGEFGTVFEIAKTDTGYSTASKLVTFNTTNGADPNAGVIIDGAGNLYGTTSGGDPSTPGTVFEMARTTTGYAAPVTLATFDNGLGVQLQSPSGTLIVDAAGNLYGLTTYGGANNQGSVYELSGTGFQVACYAHGTRIATPAGEHSVETLSAGDFVLTASGRARTITWIGWRVVDCLRHPDPSAVRPIRIQAGALADGVPCRDLVVSPDHAMLLDGVLIPARQLCNGGTIRQLAVQHVHYFHVELESHDILLAEGAAAESYLDTGNRHMFANTPGETTLHPQFTAGHAAAEAAPRAGVAQAEAIWTALAARSSMLGHHPAGEPATTTDPDLNLLVGDRIIRPVTVTADRAVFVLPHGTAEVRLISRTARPSDVQPWADDRRLLGVCIGGISLRGAQAFHDVSLDDPALNRGWWDVEHDAGRMHRWTTGDAVLPVPTGTLTVEICLAGGCRYPLAASVTSSSRLAA